MANTLRSCIIAEPGYTLVSIDASQIELRVLAILSQDPNMLEDLKTGDLHQATADRMFGTVYLDPDGNPYPIDSEVYLAWKKKKRYDAKQGNFALVYGADEFKLSQMLECTIDEALEFMAEHKRKYPVLYAWMDKIKKEAKENGYVVSMFGRIRPIPELTAGSWKIREKAERECVNTLVQGTAVDIVKLMGLYLKRVFDSKVRFLLQVHDEWVFECPDELLDKTLEGSEELAMAFPDYPCSVKTGKVYSEVEERT